MALGLAALAISVAVPYLSAGERPFGARQAALRAGNRTGGLRNAAVATGSEQLYILDAVQPSVTMAQGRSLKFARTLRLSFVTASVGRFRPPRKALSFYPDGSSTGGTVRVDDGTDRNPIQIDIDWLSGGVRVTGSRP